MILVENILAKSIIEEISREKLPDKVLCRISYPICDIGKRNANDRVYEDDVWDKVHEEKDLKEKLENRALFGHAEHPEQTQSNLEKTSHVIFEMWKDNGQEWQKLDVLDTPGGRIVDTLLRAGCRVGVSTRAEGDLEEAEDDDGAYQRVIPESYKYVTTDFTADPSTFGAIPHDVKRNVVSEIKKVYESKDADVSDKEFASCVLEGMKCKDKTKCQKCGCCEALKENKTIETLIKEGLIKVDTKVKYEDKDFKVAAIDESVSSITISPDSEDRHVKIEQGAVRVDGNPSVVIDKDGTVTILKPLETAVEEPCPSGPAAEVAAEPSSPAEAGNTGLGMPAVDVDDEIPEAKKDSAKKSKPPKRYTEEEQLKRRKEDHAAIVPENKEFRLTKENLINCLGSTVKIEEGEHKDKQGKLTVISEAGITIALDDGTTVSIEDPSAVNITVTAPAPAEEIEPVGATEEEKEQMAAAGPLPVEKDVPEEEERFESKEKVEEHKLPTEGGVSDKIAPSNLLQDKEGASWVVKEVSDINLTVTQPGAPETEKAISWDRVGDFGFTKVSERELEKESRTIVIREKDDGWSVYLTGDGKDRLLRACEEKEEAIKFAEKEAGDMSIPYKGIVETKVDEQEENGWSSVSDESIVTAYNVFMKLADAGRPFNSEDVAAVFIQIKKRGLEDKVLGDKNRESKVDETADIKAMYKAAKLPAPDGKGIHTKAFHELAINVAKGYVEGGDTPQEALDKAYPTAMKQLGKEKAVKKAHQKSEAKVDEADKDRMIAQLVKLYKRYEEQLKVEKDEEKRAELEQKLVDVEKALGSLEYVMEESKVDEGKIWHVEYEDGTDRDVTGVDSEEAAIEVSKELDPKLKIKKVTLVSHKEVEEAKESISTTAKEIKNLRVQEASTRAERDKAIELLEEIVDEKKQLKEKDRKEKAFEVKILISRIGKTMEAKEQEIGALRSKLEEKAKLAADLKEQIKEQNELGVQLAEKLKETQTNLSSDIKSLKESASSTKDKHQNALSEVKEKHQKELSKIVKSLGEKAEKDKGEAAEKIREEVTKEFVKSFVAFKLSETNLKVDDNSRALLENSKSLEEVDDLLDEIMDASRRSALHSKSISTIHISKREVTNPEEKEAERQVENVFEGMGM